MHPHLWELIIDKNISTTAEITTNYTFCFMRTRLGSKYQQLTEGWEAGVVKVWKEKCSIYTLCQKIVYLN